MTKHLRAYHVTLDTLWNSFNSTEVAEYEYTEELKTYARDTDTRHEVAVARHMLCDILTKKGIMERENVDIEQVEITSTGKNLLGKKNGKYETHRVFSINGSGINGHIILLNKIKGVVRND